MYDKFGRLPRIETTVRDVSYFTHYRKVEKRHGTTVRRRASVKKTIYSLAALRGLLAAANGCASCRGRCLRRRATTAGFTFSTSRTSRC